MLLQQAQKIKRQLPEKKNLVMPKGTSVKQNANNCDGQIN